MTDGTNFQNFPASGNEPEAERPSIRRPLPQAQPAPAPGQGRPSIRKPGTRWAPALACVGEPIGENRFRDRLRDVVIELARYRVDQFQSSAIRLGAVSGSDPDREILGVSG